MHLSPNIPPVNDWVPIARRLLWIGAIVTFVGWVGFAIWFVRLFFRENHRTTHGLCMHCGYDLRASADRCPECGTAIESGKQLGRE